MATKVHMEALSPTMEEGQIVQWLKGEGDEVSSGEVIAEIETDKATMELVARGDGVLLKILTQEGDTAPVGDVIAVIGSEDEDISDLVGDADGGAAPDDDEESADASKEDDEDPDDDAGEDPDEDADTKEDDASEDDDEDEASIPDPVKDLDRSDADEKKKEAKKEAKKDDGDETRVKASPVARRLAEEEGIDLASLEGSGPGGRIVKADVETAVREGPAEKDEPAKTPDRRAPDEEEYEDVPLSQMRKTIARRLVESIGPVPHFFLTIDVDMGRIVEARARINRQLEKDGLKVSYNDIVLKTTALALSRHPECNAHWGGDHIRRFNRVHLGVAVAIDDGLITPIVRDAERKGLVEIAQEVRELAGRAREKKLKPEEYTGASFSVSNLGMFGIEEFTAVINPPEAGILAVGAMEERAVVVDGEIVVRPRMKITMSCDHRVIDGAMGSAFLQTLKGILEEPLTAFV
ncbi:MAG: pyruvate dehydrogenase complex dihydrolipoamide acetyltransferase [Gemmatimonadales bacterium]|nr:MAG: pyruvate dehydrogenase complex dihydrolipoamide acetyltransferase [Gemmatimonadales bacterium]